MSAALDRSYELDHRYTRESGRVFLTGVQALVRLPMLQRARDEAAGLNTAGFISGYRGSPLGTYDMALWQAKEHLERHRVRFEPGVNEDLAATAVWGSQQAAIQPTALYDGVFSIWYGKGPGVDRSLDPIKHGNYMGTAKHGGVLAMCGDDPAAKSSSIAHQSEQAMIHAGIPFLNPSNVQDYLDLGLYGWALSRYSGCWVGFKCLTDTVDSGASVEVGPDRVQLVDPGFPFPPADHHVTMVNTLLGIEAQLYQVKLPAAKAFVRANGLDKQIWKSERRRFGIVTTGKSYLDVRQALEELGIDERRAADLGLSLYKVAMSWPLEPDGANEFCRGLEDVLVVEEKRPLIEEQLAHLLVNQSERPQLLGKKDETGAPLLSSVGELAPAAVREAIRRWLEKRDADGARTLRPAPEAPSVAPPGTLMRVPSFCSGCPHNTSTVLPDDSIALGGIGCHGMAAFFPERRTYGATQMGGEGSNWIGQSPFIEMPHVFQNLGDGTYFHSGLLSIRACVAANVNITFKILVNGAVAMTGGQPIEGEPMAGEITCPEIAHQLQAEGVGTIVVVSDDVTKYSATAFPRGVTVRHRDKIIQVQKELREIPGVTALVYDQTCAAEARRLRKRGEFPDPDTRIVINEAVCEGCGDCSVQSNCISIEPVETEFGRKRRINQSSCNKDYSCVKGYCPSFVSVIGGTLRKAESPATGPAAFDPSAGLPEPTLPALDEPFNVLLAGIGGTGVVTIGAILTMAAHLENKGASELDVTGLAQKNGAVSSHVRIAAKPEDIHATRIGVGGCDVMIGCDPVVATNPEHLPKIAARTTAIMNRHVAPTSEFATNSDLDLSPTAMEDAVRAAAGDENAHFLNATEWATALLGDAIATNMFLLGYAWQLGRIPVSREAMDRAIELNGRGIELNRKAFAWGRLAAHDAAKVEEQVKPLLREVETAPAEKTLEELLAIRIPFLTEYQSARYARQYESFVRRVAEREKGVTGSDALARAVARYYFKLLAYKDEYEVARLYLDGRFEKQIEQQFENVRELKFHLSLQFLPPWLVKRDPETGRAPKLAFPKWFAFGAWRAMRAIRFLRFTPLDPFGWTADRKLERQLPRDYVTQVEELLAGLTPENHPTAIEIAKTPELIRGFGTVKDAHLEEARKHEAELLEAFRRQA